MREFLNSLMGEQWGDKCIRLDESRAFATDGHGFLIVDGVVSDTENKSLQSAIKKLVGNRKVAESRTIDADVLAHWLPSDGPFALCDECDGGMIKKFPCDNCNGKGRESCRHCGHDSECSTCGGAKYSTICPECAGAGEVRRKRSPAWVHGNILMDRRLVQRFFAQLNPSTITVTWSGDTDPVFFEAPGWLMGLMPMRATDGDEPAGALFP